MMEENYAFVFQIYGPDIFAILRSGAADCRGKPQLA